MICSKEKCTGCYACFNICPKNAIEMQKDEFGNVFPYIKSELCINCNLCKKCCPQLKDELEFKMPIDAYAMYVKDSDKRKESTSGGAATVFYEYILKNNGVVYGVSNIFGQSDIGFVRIDNINDLYKVKGSKYVHSYVKEIFKEVKKDLNDKMEVLFIGTPCQISGLQSFLMKKYNNLITVDIICHGVPSQKLLYDELEKLDIDYHDVKQITFRDEKGFNLKITSNEDSVIYEDNSMNSDYYRNFLAGNFYRNNCYSCRYAKIERISDITIGDFWGLGDDSIIKDDEKKGISLLLPNTEKGILLVKNIEEQSKLEKRTINEACKTNGQLNHPMKKTKAYEVYKNNYKKNGYKITMRKMLSLKEKIRIFCRNNKIIYFIYKKLK